MSLELFAIPALDFDLSIEKGSTCASRGMHRQYSAHHNAYHCAHNNAVDDFDLSIEKGSTCASRGMHRQYSAHHNAYHCAHN